VQITRYHETHLHRSCDHKRETRALAYTFKAGSLQI